MNWFSALFLCAAVVALVTGTACFRGVVHRDSDPLGYWSTVGSYLALALLGPILHGLR